MRNYSISKGKIIDHGRWGDPGWETIIYSYIVDSIEYKRSIHPNEPFKECEVNFDLCMDKRFWVIYNNQDHSKSLIKLTEEIQRIKDPCFPETLEGFE